MRDKKCEYKKLNPIIMQLNGTELAEEKSGSVWYELHMNGYWNDSYRFNLKQGYKSVVWEEELDGVSRLQYSEVV